MDLRLVDVQLGQAAFVVDRHGGAVVHGILDVIDADIVAEYRAGILVAGLHRRAGKPDEGRAGQSVAQVLGKAVFVLAGLFVEHGTEAILRAVRLVGDDDNIGPFGQPRELLLIFVGREFLHGGKDDAAGRTAVQQLTQLLAVFRLLRGFLQQGTGADKGLIQLPVQVVTVSDHDNGRILHRRLLHQLAGKAHHGNALARALGVPDDAALA